MVYASETRALACLETVVHLNAGGLPLNRQLVRIDVPDELWSEAEVLDVSTLPIGWDAEPPGRASLDLGSEWLRARRSAILLAPSVIVPEERNALINPRRPEAGTIKAEKVRKWTYDPRLRRSS